MVELKFEDLEFEHLDAGGIRVYFLKRFYFDLEPAECRGLNIKNRNKIEFKGTERQFNQQVSRKIDSSLICGFTLIFLVIFLKALGRWILSMNKEKDGRFVSFNRLNARAIFQILNNVCR